MRKVLILGRLPPPVGGITVHVSRLIENLEHRNFTNFTFCDFGKELVLKIASNILKHKVIHFHVSRPSLQFLFAIFCRICGKKLLITYHGDWGRYNRFGNWLVNISAWLSTVPIVQNDASLGKAKLLNKRALLISTFLSTPTRFPLPVHIYKTLENFRKAHQQVLCTNAWDLTFDKNGKETYGILGIVSRIKHFPDTGLIVSDPSGNYFRFAQKTLLSIPVNVIFINEPHDFRNILCLSDAFIRNTSTDGVSLSIHEAFELNVPILASAAVKRPAFCKVYDDIDKINFREHIELARKLLKENTVNAFAKEPIKELIQLYGSIIDRENGKHGQAVKKTKA